MKITEAFEFGRAIGGTDYADAIALLKAQIAAAPKGSRGLKYTWVLLSNRQWKLAKATEPGSNAAFQSALQSAYEALKLDANFFDAHRLLASIYVHQFDHVLGALHAQLAIKHFKATVRIPAMMGALGLFVIFLRAGFAKAKAYRENVKRSSGSEWVSWAKEYLIWNQGRGTLDPANQIFRPAPALK